MTGTSRLFAAIAAMACLAVFAGSATAQCMVANPSFEIAGSNGATFGGWSQFGPTGLYTTSVVHGASAARVTGPNTGAWAVSGFWQTLTSSPGQRWNASVSVLVPSATPLVGGSAALLNIEWHDSAGNLISYESHNAADVNTPTDVWHTYSVQSGAAPAGTASIHFVIGVLQGPTDPTPTVAFDVASCVSAGPPTLDSLQWGDFGSMRTLTFSGRTWRVKGPGYLGPGPNNFDNSASAASVDANGRLHLTIHKIGANWYSSEVALTQALGYGDYVFTTRGALNLLDMNTVLGMFIWEYGPCYDNGYLWWNPYNEIDVEIGRWGYSGNADGQFVAQPASTNGNLHRFNVTLADTELASFAMRWLPGRVEFRSWRGGPDAEATSAQIASWTYSGVNVPVPDQPRVHLNLWQLAAPTTTQEAVFDAFTFRPGCSWGDCGLLAVAPSPAPASALAPAAPNPFGSGTVIAWTLARAGHADLSIYDLAGRRIRRLVDEASAAGAHVARWDGRNDAGAHVAPGVYLYRLRSGDTVEARRVVVLR